MSNRRDHLEELVEERTAELARANEQLQKEISRRRRLEKQLEAIYQLGRELNLLRDETAIVMRALELAANVLRFEYAGYGWVDEAAAELEYRYYIIRGVSKAIKLRLPLEGGKEGIGVAVVLSGQAINVPDTEQEARYIPIPEVSHGRSELCVPMKVNERVIGVLNAESDEPNYFSPPDQQLLQTLADRVAFALENARLNREGRQRIAELATLNVISQAVISTLDLRETLTVITDHTTWLLGVAAASVALYDQANDELWFAATSGKGSDYICGKRLGMGQGIVGWVVQHGEPVLVPDVSQDPRFFGDFDNESGFTTRSILCVPLQATRRTIGAIEALNKEGGPFDPEDLRLLISLAAPAATAIENARLHAETERRAEQLAVLHELDRAITANLRITDVYHAFARHAARLLPHDRTSITLLEGQNIRVAFVNGDDATTPPAGATLPLTASAIGWVAARGQPLLRHGVTADARFAGDEQLIASGMKSAMVIPLRARGRVIGTWNVGSRHIGAYSPDDLIIAQSMADQLAIAIENARLFEAEQQARQTAEILQAANLALTQTLDLDAVLETLLEYLERLVPYDSANVMLLEDDSRMVVRAIRGYERWTDPEKARAVIFDTRSNPVVRALLTTQETVLIPDTYQHPGWERRAAGQHVRNWLGVLLVAGGKVIGIYSLDKAQAGFFTQEHRRMAESLAGQAAVAIQNAQLFEQVRTGRERLQTLSRRLVEVQETERHHIARELHDQAGQALTSLMVGLRLLERDADHPRAIMTRVAELKGMADGVSENLHQLAMDLRPASLDHVGLVAALQQYVETFSRQQNLVVQFEAVGLDGERLSPEVETALYRIVQEALTNVVRHAQATRVGVVLERRGDRVIAIVEDDGVGFDSIAAMQRGRLGLLGMRERAEMLGGTLVVESSAGAGTTLFVEVPYVHQHPDRR